MTKAHPSPEIIAGQRGVRSGRNRLIRRRDAGMICSLRQRDLRRIMRTKPVVGVIGNASRLENRFQVQMVGERNLRAVAQVAGALPLMFASCPEITDIGALLDTVDGIVLTGARANVHPTRFKHRAAPEARALRHSSRRGGVGVVGSLCRPRRAAVRHLPRPAGDERGLRRLAASGDPRDYPGA